MGKYLLFFVLTLAGPRAFSTTLDELMGNDKPSQKAPETQISSPVFSFFSGYNKSQGRTFFSNQTAPVSESFLYAGAGHFLTDNALVSLQVEKHAAVSSFTAFPGAESDLIPISQKESIGIGGGLTFYSSLFGTGARYSQYDMNIVQSGYKSETTSLEKEAPETAVTLQAKEISAPIFVHFDFGAISAETGLSIIVFSNVSARYPDMKSKTSAFFQLGYKI